MHSALINYYQLVYGEPSSYEHEIILMTKNYITNSAIENASKPISETLLRAIEFQDNAPLVPGIKINDKSSNQVKAIHRATVDKWHQPEVPMEEIETAFMSDLLQKLQNKEMNDLLSGIEKTINKTISIG